MLRLILILFLLYIAYKFYQTFIRYKKKVDELERELKKRKIDELRDTDYEEIKD